MIKNQWQYKVTKSRVKDFEKSLQEFLKLPPVPEQPWLRAAQREAIEEELKDLRTQLQEYEDLQSGKAELPKLDMLDKLPSLLIKWRIARHLTHQELADKLGWHYQQIQQYENTDYSSATLETMHKIASALSDENQVRSQI